MTLSELQGGMLTIGERIAGVSAILLYVSMCFDWFGVKATNTSNLLFLLEGPESGKSALEALDYIPIVLLITIAVTLAVAVLRLANALHRPPAPVNAVVAILGFISMLLILFRIVDLPNVAPPIPGYERIITSEVTTRFPIFLALLSAGGIAFGGCLAMWEEASPSPIFARAEAVGEDTRTMASDNDPERERHDHDEKWLE